MKRLKISLALALSLSLVFFSSQAIAAVKPGSACKKLGATSTSVSTKYTCVQSGKKLIWNKGVKIVKPVLAPTPTPSPIPSPTPSPTPTQKPEPFQPTSFDDLIAHPESMSYWAWKNSSEKISKASDLGPTVVVHLGPNTTQPFSNAKDAIVATTRLYSGFAIPSTVHVIYYNYEDISWGQSEFAKYALRPSGQEAARQCQTPKTCWGAMAEVDMRGNGILLIGSGVTDSNHTTGTLEAHEFAHTIQSTQFMGTGKEANSYCCIKAHLPWWTVEGGAEFAQAAAIYPSSYELYLGERRADTSEFLSNSQGKFTYEWILNYLSPPSYSVWSDSANNWRMYDVGFIANEAFVAIKGPDISMQLNKDVANGMSWAQAFEKNFGLSWADALPKLAKAIKAQLSN